MHITFAGGEPVSRVREQGQAMSWFVNFNGSLPAPLPQICAEDISQPKLGEAAFSEVLDLSLWGLKLQILRKGPVISHSLSTIFSGQAKDRVWSEAMSTYLIFCKNLK